MKASLTLALWMLVWACPCHAYHANLREAGRSHRQDARLKGVIEEENMDYWLDLGQNEIDAALVRMTRNTRVAKNIVLFVGDGMSIPTITATRIYKDQQRNNNFVSPEKAHLSYDRFPSVALSKTYCIDEQTADSASSATAIFSGVKTLTSTLGFDSSIVAEDPNSMLTAREVETVLTWAQEAGKKTGLVSTARVTHATPAALYAHTCDRDWECDTRAPNDNAEVPDGTHDIAWQLVRNRPGNATNVVFGGGLSAFIPAEEKEKYTANTWDCYREDGDNLLEAWREWHGDNAKTVHNREQLMALDDTTEFVFGLFSENHVAFEDQRDQAVDPSIVDMTAKAVELLLNNDGSGFFLMVEGGRIDHAHHDTQAVRALNEAMFLDLAVEETLRRLEAAGQLEDTLVIVTADHSHTMSINGYPIRGNDIVGLSGSTHDDGLPYTTLSYANGQGYYFHNILSADNASVTRLNLSSLSEEEIKSFDFVQTSAGFEEAGGETHGGDDVAIFAQGPMAHLFHSTHEQTHIAFVMAYSACIGPYAGDARCENERGSAPINKPLGLIIGGLLWAVFTVWSNRL